ncbi:hypothetical protein KQH54_01130 [bacterium]|nr:hypothetical protein [bacterium]
MPITTPTTIDLTVDDVLRGQGANPEIIRQRNPKFAQVAEEALQIGLSVISPQILYEWKNVDRLLHEKLILEDGQKLSGSLISQHLKKAEKVVFILVTLGAELDELVSTKMASEPVLGIALDGVGSAAAEQIANQICAEFEAQAALEGLQASIPLSPGMLNWDVHVGQPEIFQILDASEVGVSLTYTGLMLPRKSLSMVLGFGKEMSIQGSTCDYCAMKETCSYRDHYEEQALVA